MASKSLFILLCSEEHEKIQMAAMLASVAAVSDRPVHVFVSMGAMYAFAKDGGEDRYKGGAFSDVLKKQKAPDAMELFSTGKMLGEMTVSPCAMALDVLEWGMDDLVPDLFDEPLGLTKFLSDAEEGQFISL